MKPIKPKKPPTRQNDRNLSECKLLDAAQQMFTKLGFDASTTRMIASCAGVNLALISKYFGSKEGLLLSLLENRTRQVFTCLNGYPEQKDLQSELRAHYNYLLDMHFSTGGVHLMKIIISKSLTDENFCTETKKRLVTDNKVLVDRMEKFKKAGMIRADVDLHHIEEQLAGYFKSQVFFQAILFEDDKENVRIRLERFADTIARAYTV